jgi:hypothetical protein
VIAIARNRYSDRQSRTSGCFGEPGRRAEICDRGEDLVEEAARLVLGERPAKHDLVPQHTELGEFDGHIKGIAVAECLEKRRDKWVVESLQKGKARCIRSRSDMLWKLERCRNKRNGGNRANSKV